MEPTPPPSPDGELEGMHAFLSVLKKLVAVDCEIEAGLKLVRKILEDDDELVLQDSGSKSSGCSTVDGDMLKDKMASLHLEQNMYCTWHQSIEQKGSKVGGDSEDV
jgi:hypothetical protein